MRAAPKLSFDVASAVAMGKRETQEDAIVADFPIGGCLGFVVLADGMGGHNAGDIASKIVVTEVFSELKLRGGEMMRNPACVAETLRNAAEVANQCLNRHTSAHPRTEGMGATLVGLVQMEDALFWISVGDSVLYLVRNGKMRRLNEDHSLAPQIDYMVRQGLLTEEAGRNHPDRNCLTSALRGEEIPFVDCPEKPLRMRDGDVILAASDGLPFLGDAAIHEILDCEEGTSSAALADRLLHSIDTLDHPEQDNVCLTVLKVSNPGGAQEAEKIQQLRQPEAANAPVSDVAAMAGPGLLGKLRGLRTGLTR